MLYSTCSTNENFIRSLCFWHQHQINKLKKEAQSWQPSMISPTIFRGQNYRKQKISCSIKHRGVHRPTHLKSKTDQTGPVLDQKRGYNIRVLGLQVLDQAKGLLSNCFIGLFASECQERKRRRDPKELVFWSLVLWFKCYGVGLRYEIRRKEHMLRLWNAKPPIQILKGDILSTLGFRKPSLIIGTHKVKLKIK